MRFAGTPIFTPQNMRFAGAPIYSPTENTFGGDPPNRTTAENISRFTGNAVPMIRLL